MRPPRVWSSIASRSSAGFRPAAAARLGPITITLEPVSSRKRPRWPLTRAGTIQTPSPDSSGTRTSPSPAAVGCNPARPSMASRAIVDWGSSSRLTWKASAAEARRPSAASARPRR
ncbi:MAG: hypothetical protein DME13_16110 [Candidatus Rokuibacteriota bacterium]|nr:MAG: hypothetical protein DME13_16110 [Candidatus Rokubacteria bacterium]